MTKRIAVYPGTFDPVTKGHVDIVKRAIELFDEVIVAVAASVRKQPSFTLQDRLKMWNILFSQESKVQIKSFDSLIVDFVRENNARYLIKGIRNVFDCDYEFQMAHMNQMMHPQIETVFLPAKQEYAFISATQVREIYNMGGDFSAFVPAEIAEHLQRK